MIRRLLVALDESRRAPLVFARALELGTAFGAELILFRALAVPQEYPPAAASAADELEPHLTERARSELADYARRAGGCQARIVVRLSMEPDEAIIAAAEELNVDLVVMGSHGYGGWDRLLGTTAAGVVNRSKRDVLVVHDRALPDPSPTSRAQNK